MGAVPGAHGVNFAGFIEAVPAVLPQRLDPLRLSSTCLAPYTCPASDAALMPTGYLYIAGVPASLLGQAMPALALTEDQGAGGIVTSLADLTTWDRALYQGQLLPPPQQRQLESLVSVAAGKPIGNTTLAVNSATAADNDDVADLAGSVYHTLEKEGAVHAS
jgi:hypothetical protein